MAMFRALSAARGVVSRTLASTDATAALRTVGGSINGCSSSMLTPAAASLMQHLRHMSGSKLFVGGLSWETDEGTLRDAFSSFGEVSEAKVIIDRVTGRSRGFGFVSFASEEEAQSALSSMDGKFLAGRTIRVDYAMAREPRPAGGGGGGGGGFRRGGGGFGGGGGYGGGGGRGGYGGGGGGYGGGGGGRRGDYGGRQSDGGYGAQSNGGYGGAPSEDSGYGGQSSGYDAEPGFGSSSSGGTAEPAAAVEGGAASGAGDVAEGGSPSSSTSPTYGS